MNEKFSSTIEESFLLDWATRIGLAARQEDVKASQLENIILTLDSVEGNEALLVVATFARRQAQRLGRGGLMSSMVSRAMYELYTKGGTKDHARKMLSFAKWVYEALTYPPRGKLDQFKLEDFVKLLAGVK
jgi:hypothetical protein